MHQSVGTLSFRHSALALEVDQGIVDYYYHWLKTNTTGRLNKQLYTAHITIISSRESIPKPFISPVLHNKITFQYSNDIALHHGYYYLPVQPHPDFIFIRERYNLGPCFDPIKGYHITIANCK